MNDDPNPYSDKALREAWAKGNAAARKRYGSRASNPYGDSSLRMAWDAGWDAHKNRKSRLI